MGYSAFIKGLYLANVQNVNMRYRTHPADAAGVAVADDAAWDQIIAATVITDAFHHLSGIQAYYVGSAADFEEQVEEGTGGADGAAIAPADTLVAVAIANDFTSVTAAGTRRVDFFPLMLPVPIRVERAADRHAMRISTSATGGQALLGSINVITGLGT